MNSNNKTELVIANHELKFQILQKEKRVASLVIDNKKLAFLIDENEKCIQELKNNNKELAFRFQQNKLCHTDLDSANKDLLSQFQEKEKQSALLLKTNIELQNSQESQKKYIKGLESILFKTSHRIRQPICNILGLSFLLDENRNSNDELKVFIDFIKESAETLDVYTHELTNYTFNLKQKLDLKVT